MRQLIYLIVFAFIFNGCGSYANEFTFNADGSGEYKVNYDIGAMMKQMETMFESMKDSTQMEEIFGEIEGGDEEDEYIEYNEDTDEENIVLDDEVYEEYSEEYEDEIVYEVEEEVLEEEDEYDEEIEDYIDEYNYEDEDVNYGYDETPMEVKESYIQKFFTSLEVDGIKPSKVDTLVTFDEIYPDSIKKLTSYPALLKNNQLSLFLNEDEKEGLFTYRINWDSEDEMEKAFVTFSEILKLDADENNPSEIENSAKDWKDQMENLTLNTQDGTLIINAVDYVDDMELAQMLDQPDFTDEKFSKFMEMLGLTDIEVIYHLPSKITSIEAADFEMIDENSVKIKEKIIDLIKNKKTSGATINFEPIKK